MIELLIERPWNKPYGEYNPERNGNYINAFGGGKKKYTHRHPFNIITEEIYD